MATTATTWEHQRLEQLEQEIRSADEKIQSLARERIRHVEENPALRVGMITTPRGMRVAQRSDEFLKQVERENSDAVQKFHALLHEKATLLRR